MAETDRVAEITIRAFSSGGGVMNQQVVVKANHVRDVSQAAAETGAIARNGLDATQPVMWNKAGDYFYQYDSPTSLNPPKEFNDEALAKRVKEDEEKREEERSKIPNPTSASPPPPELVPDDSKAIAVCLSPDVCRSPDKPVPYSTWGQASDSQNYSPDVRSNGMVIKRQDSIFFCCYGDEAGIGLGVKSNTVGDVVEPVTSSQVVRANGIWVQRHDDRCTLNNGNTVGEYIYVQCTDTHAAPDATDSQDGSSADAADTRGNGEKFLDGFTDNAGETWEGLKQVGSDMWSGTKDLASDLYNDPGGTLAAGAENVKDGVTGAANWTGEVAQNLYDDPGATLGRGVDNVTNTASSIWHAVSDPYAEAYAEGGLAQAAGHGTFDVVKLAVEALATKGAATAAGKAATIGAGAAAKVHRAEEVVETANDARKIERKSNGGEHGARSVQKLSVRCFDLPRNVNRGEFRRQLQEQQATINSMTADDMAYAHAVLDRARQQWGDRPGSFTNLLRDGKAQEAVRADYRRSLEAAGVSEEDIVAEMGRVNATHYLDIIAGGDPTALGIGGGAENQRIGPMWTQHGRADSLKETANAMRAAGRAGDMMDVELKICGER
jgi:hypothetical protein